MNSDLTGLYWPSDSANSLVTVRKLSYLPWDTYGYGLPLRADIVSVGLAGTSFYKNSVSRLRYQHYVSRVPCFS